MKTIHLTKKCSADDFLTSLPNESVDLIVTSPPYPLISMWDDLFKEVGVYSEEPHTYFKNAHEYLLSFYEKFLRVLKTGGIICINIGDAVRSWDEFQLWPNGAATSTLFYSLPNVVVLPRIYWKKPTNSPNKFMGSGLLPVNAYVTLDTEHILIFRKGKKVNKKRTKSAFFFHERNKWFSSVWDIPGTNQGNERTAAFPVEIPYRLINMFSCIGDVVLDPFGGTFTTSIAAATSKRHSLSCDLRYGQEYFQNRINIAILNKRLIQRSIEVKRAGDHIVGYYKKGYYNPYFEWSVKSELETNIRKYKVSKIVKKDTTKVYYRMD